MNKLAQRHSQWVSSLLARQGKAPEMQRQLPAQIRHGRYATEPQYPITVMHNDAWDPDRASEAGDRPQQGSEPDGGAWYTVHLPGDQNEEGTRVYAMPRDEGMHGIMSSPDGRMNGLGLAGVISSEDYGYLQSTLGSAAKQMTAGPPEPEMEPVKLPTGETYVPLKLTGTQLSKYARVVNSANRLSMGDNSALSEFAPGLVHAFGNSEAALQEVMPRLKELREQQLTDLNDADPDGVKAKYVSDMAHQRRGERMIVFAQNPNTTSMLANRLEKEGHSVDSVTHDQAPYITEWNKENWFHPNEYTAPDSAAHILITDDPGGADCPYMHHSINYNMAAGIPPARVKPITNEFLGTDSPHEIRTRPGMIASEMPGKYPLQKALTGDEPEWWHEPYIHPFGYPTPDIPTLGANQMDWLDRYKVPQEDGRYVFYHATTDKELTSLRAGSLLETDPEKAAFYATRDRDRRVKPDIHKVLLHPWEFHTGVFPSLRSEYKLQTGSAINYKLPKDRFK